MPEEEKDYSTVSVFIFVFASIFFIVSVMAK